MKTYKLFVPLMALLFAGLSCLLREYAPMIAFILGLISIVMTIAWTSSNYPEKIFEHLRKAFKVEPNSAGICTFFMIVGILLSVELLSMYGTEPIGKTLFLTLYLGSTYSIHFFIMIYFPLSFATYLVTRFIMDFKMKY